MRAHNREVGDARQLTGYMYKSGAEPLGGSLYWRGRDDLTARLVRLGGGRPFLHITLSLPEGTRASDSVALRMIATELSHRGVDPHAIPWAAVRHTDRTCDHVHVGLTQATFLGRPVDLNLTCAQSHANDRKLRAIF
ncbi:relaxase/mobilization nuclease domain-containing protein, partial [Limimaricola cinnabarinus]|uniref:relaxase/mobilization nuclease domain-containing protein n=1 Tax=Limimaricola cinnabarinus TaxID=1125964 RepID=UPI002492F483